MSSVQCSAITRRGERCKNRVKNNRGLCRVHTKIEIPKPKKVSITKPAECPVCFLSLEEEKEPLACGHWVHLECVKKHFRPECPVCRQKLNIKVEGSLPSTNINNVRDIPGRGNGPENVEVLYHGNVDDIELDDEAYVERNFDGDDMLALLLATGFDQLLLENPNSSLYAFPVSTSRHYQL